MSGTPNHIYVISFTVGSEAGLAMVVAENERKAFQILNTRGTRTHEIPYVLQQIRDIGMTAECTYGILLESFVNALEAFHAIVRAANKLVGPQGISAYEVAVKDGFTGTVTEWLASLKGDKGDTGDKGDRGDTGAKGDKGDTGDKGDRGIRGERGEKGADGADGLTSYEIASRNGFYGTEAEWISVLMSGNSFELSWEGDSVPDESLVPAGVTVQYDGTTYTGELEAGADTLGKFYLVYDGDGEYVRYFTSFDGTDYSWVSLGTTELDLDDYVRKDSEVWLTRTEFDALSVKQPGVTYNIYEEEESE